MKVKKERMKTSFNQLFLEADGPSGLRRTKKREKVFKLFHEAGSCDSRRAPPPPPSAAFVEVVVQHLAKVAKQEVGKRDKKIQQKKWTT